MSNFLCQRKCQLGRNARILACHSPERTADSIMVQYFQFLFAVYDFGFSTFLNNFCLLSGIIVVSEFNCICKDACRMTTILFRRVSNSTVKVS